MERIHALKRPMKVIVILVSVVTLCMVVAFWYWAASGESAALEAISNSISGDTESEIIVEEAISFGSETVDDPDLEQGLSEVRQKGEDGKKKITFRVTKDREGNEVNREYVREEVIRQPVNEIVAVGTKVAVTVVSSNGYGGMSYVSGSGSNASSSSHVGGQTNGGSITTTSSSPGSGDATGSSSGRGSSGPHYCTSPYQLEAGDKGVYIKVSVPCSEIPGKWSVYTVEVSSADYYSREVCSGYGLSDILLEVRCKR